METLIKTDEVKAKLKTFKGDYHYTEFCEVLAKRLGPDTTPLLFLLSFSLLCSDMEKGDGMFIRGIGEPIRSRLSGMPLGGIMNMMLPKIVDHAFPPEFAEEVKRELRNVRIDALPF